MTADKTPCLIAQVTSLHARIVARAAYRAAVDPVSRRAGVDKEAVKLSLNARPSEATGLEATYSSCSLTMKADDFA